MFSASLPLERELNFTRVYRAHLNDDKASREYHCLKEQIPQSFRTLKHPHSDLFAGRIEDALVGFYSLFAGNKGIDKCGYCIREDKCRETLEDMERRGGYPEEYLEEIREMLEFWHERYTVAKIKSRQNADMVRSFPSDYDYHVEISAVYPLYRIAGVHLDCRKLLRYGLTGLIRLIRDKRESSGDEKSIALYRAMEGSLQILRDVCAMYEREMLRLLENCEDEKRRRELSLMAQSLRSIRDERPQTLHEAIQLITLYMLATGAREMGRLDDTLCAYFSADVKSGRITREFAVRMLVNFFDIIEEELIRDTRLIIGGVGRHDEAAADEFSLVILDALDRRPMNLLPQVSLRWYRELDPRVYDRSLELLSKGRTYPMLYNDEVNVAAVMRAFDVPRGIAEQYAFFGCGEYVLQGKSIGTPNALINLAKLLELTLHNGVDPVTGREIGVKTGEITDDITYDELLRRFWRQADYAVDLAARFKEMVYDGCNEDGCFLLISVLTDDCIERGRAIFDGGIYHLGGTIETYGNITAADSLTAIREVVFEQRRFTLPALVHMLDCDFNGYEHEQKLLKNAQKFGNDLDGADATAVMVHEGICGRIREQKHHTRLDSLLAVVINNGTNVGMGQKTGATPDGRNAFVPLSNANNAFNVCDKEGVTALMKSMTKMDTSIHAGANQNFKFSPVLFRGSPPPIKGIFEGFFKLGGQQMNISVVDQSDLEDAMLHPEAHENLMVRVGGYTARFVTLDEPTQRDILLRTAY